MAPSYPGLFPDQESVHLTLQQLSEAAGQTLSRRAQKLALQYLVERRACPLCGADYSQWCRTYGWTSTVMRTHPVRLRMTPGERERVALWAVREEERLAGQNEATEDDD